MTHSGADIERLFEAERSRIADRTLLQRTAEWRVGPYPVERAWNYGAPGESYVCWTVIEHPRVNIGIAYCDAGFGPEHPWGLVFLGGPHMSIGMDTGWFARLEDAMEDLAGWDGEETASACEEQA